MDTFTDPLILLVVGAIFGFIDKFIGACTMEMLLIHNYKRKLLCRNVLSPADHFYKESRLASKCWFDKNTGNPSVLQ